MADVVLRGNQLRDRNSSQGKASQVGKMQSANFLIFLSAIFGLNSAIHAPSVATAPHALRSLSPTQYDHLCTVPTDVGFEYGDQTNQDGIKTDCDKLSRKLKTFADQNGNFTWQCSHTLGFFRFNNEGNCSMWFKCDQTTEGNGVEMAYGDVAEVIKLATDGLESSGQSDNSSILSVSASMNCQLMEGHWIVAFNGSETPPGS